MRVCFIFIFLFIITSCLAAQSKMRGPDLIRSSKLNISVEESWIKTVYSKYVSPVDGNRCLMYPSCSTYAELSIKRYGPIIGFFMTCDRLTRCGSDLQLYPLIIIKEQQRFYDPVKD